jgi:hypothetical protein
MRPDSSGLELTLEDEWNAMLERNVSVFNRDVEQRGGYVHTTVDSWSASIATARQTDAIVRVLEERFPRDVRIERAVEATPAVRLALCGTSVTLYSRSGDRQGYYNMHS